jgi:hypothetical protein
LILRAGEMADGGTMNCCIITFNTFYRTSSDLELGDIIEVFDDLLDPIDERYWRVMKLEDQEQSVEGGGFLFLRRITASLHFNEIYDDTAYTISAITCFPLGSTTQTNNPSGADGFPLTERLLVTPP